MKRFICILMLLAAASVHAGPRTGANYSVITDTTDSGGGRTTGAAVVNDGSLGGIGGISSAGAAVAKDGYAGQLYDVTGLTLTAGAATVNETATVQLGAWQSLDDATFLAVAATDVVWSVPSGPLTGIDLNGLATADVVYEDTAAVAQGIHAGLTGSLNLTVINVSNDDIPGYSGDGIDDAWQVQYFGLGNPDAGPLIDPDFDGQNNFFEFTAGLVPNDPGSRFLLNPSPVPNQPGQMNLLISPLVAGRTYTVKSSPTLGPGASWNPLTSFSTSDNGNQRTITDLDATGSAKFYTVEIAKP